jgi:beta-glucosidase
MRFRLPAAALICLAAHALTAPRPEAASRPRLSAQDDAVRPLLARMTLEEKVGQMTQPDQQFLVEERDIETYFLGSLLSGGDSDPKTNRLADWTAMVERYQSHTAKTRLRIPLLYGVDAVHGHSNVLGAVIFPHNVGLGATRDPALVEEIGRLTAEEVRATAINWAFAPCVTVPRDERWGRTYEGFSEDPKLVAELGQAAVRGLQGTDLRDPRCVLACAKHYVGDGGTSFGTGRRDEKGQSSPLDRGDTRMDEATLRRIHLPGYRTAIEAGVGSIMPSYSSWNGVKCSGSRRLLTEILKEELGFEGFVISDYDAIDELPGDYRSDIKQSINAGMDMVMVPQKYREFFATLKSLVEAGEVPLSRIDDAVIRILRVKAAMGLLEAGRPLAADPSLQKSFGSREHREVARRAVRESLVLLKNEKRALPLSRQAARIHVAGKSADDLGNQCGGWTITWQGKSGAPTTGTTVLAAIRDTVSKQTKVTFSIDGSGAAGADAGVVVVGETPYAEWFGDRRDLALSKDDQEAIASVKKAGMPVVVVLLSGRPMIINDALPMADAFVAAWLPGTEGQGVADVLFGDYKPTGKLAFTWPRSTAQIPINLGDASYDPLFPYGFGLSYLRVADSNQ